MHGLFLIAHRSLTRCFSEEPLGLDDRGWIWLLALRKERPFHFPRSDGVQAWEGPRLEACLCPHGGHILHEGHSQARDGRDLQPKLRAVRRGGDRGVLV